MTEQRKLPGDLGPASPEVQAAARRGARDIGPWVAQWPETLDKVWKEISADGTANRLMDKWQSKTLTEAVEKETHDRLKKSQGGVE